MTRKPEKLSMLTLTLLGKGPAWNRVRPTPGAARSERRRRQVHKPSNGALMAEWRRMNGRQD